MRLIIYTGKGGTGKTVTACATAIKLAERNHRTLLISSDPAHTLSDAISTEIGYEVRNVLANLEAIEIDPIFELTTKYMDLLSYTTNYLFGKGIDSHIAYEIAMMPGMTQLFSLLKIEEVVRKKDYDSIILDMPPSGEALRFLYFPKIVSSIGKNYVSLGNFFGGIAKIFQPFSSYYTSLESFISHGDILKRLDDLFNIISDHSITSLRLVTNLDSFSVKNAKRALMSASLFGINIDLVIINKINLKNQYDNRIEDIKTNFFPLPCKTAKLYSTELRGIEMLKRYGEEIFSSQDPSKIYFKENIYSIYESNDSISIRFKIPFIKGADIQTKKTNDEVLIQIRHAIGYIANSVTLPLAAINMKLVSTKLTNNELEIILKR
ncbi:MAG: TRC40/GET3/ArsA family transport-energizing ATPase [Nitrososphaeraceae archaeon]